MRQISIIAVIAIIVELLFHQCANPVRPTGGPKDTIPPQLIYSYPEDQKINFKGQELRLSFDEFIKADQLKQKLVITPLTDIKYKSLIKKRDLIIRFEAPFSDSTTYMFNFFDAITDITERNPAENIVIAFSTGNYIDSLTVSGSVYSLMDNKPLAKTTVGLYQLTDSLDVLKDLPYYFINTLEDGSFNLRNLKKGKFIIVSFLDENKNLKLDVTSESYAFLSDTINTAHYPDSLKLYQFKVDASDIKFISARPNGKYFDIRYSKPLNKYHYYTLDSSKNHFSQLAEEKDVVRFFTNDHPNPEDSSGLVITVYDTLSNSLTDTVFVKFRESARKSFAFEYQLHSPSSNNINSSTNYSIHFNKPIVRSDTLKPVLLFDTLYTHPIQCINSKWNFNQTIFTFNLQLDQSYYQSIYDSLLTLNTVDTANIDSLKLLNTLILQRLPKDRIFINYPSGTFISVENDTSELISQKIQFPVPENFGSILLNMKTTRPSYEIQLLDSKLNVVRKIWNCSSCTFNNLKPGDYQVRVLIDQNNNGAWEIGNIQTLLEPEPVILFAEKSALRANWQLELNYTF